MEAVTISDLSSRLLEENRHALNARFQQRKVQGAKIDADMWLQHIRHRILPLVDAVYESETKADNKRSSTEIQSRCFQTLNQLYEVSLDLFSAGHFTETTGLLPEALASLWDETLPALASTLSMGPKVVAGKLSNCVLTIAKSQSGSVRGWLDLLQRVSAKVRSVEELMSAGQVAAWAAGLPEHRCAAVEIAKSLPADLVACLLNLPAHVSEQDLQELLLGLGVNPWQKSLLAEDTYGIKLVARCGAFQGFGGVFLFPPTVFQDDRNIYATDGKSVWRLLADSFGQAFIRCDLSREETKRLAARGSPTIDKSGKVSWANDSASMPELANSTSSACDGQTLAVTIPSSFHVYLITQFNWASSQR
ncbi:MAG: hypothetical protein U0930_06010 [Pirellulales bacterium]